MTEAKTDNLEAEIFAESSESESQEADNFFEALDRKVNEGILEPEENTADTGAYEQNLEETSETGPQEYSEQEHDWEKRYKDSSSEARRLNDKVSEFEPYLPILDAMKQDPNLISHVRNYFEGGGDPPKSVKEQLGLDEDFIFDPDEAIGNSGSDSSKVLQSVIDGVVQRRLKGFAQGQQKATQVQTQESDFRQRHDMTDGEWQEFQDYSKSRTLTLDDIYFLKNRDNRDRQVADSTRKEMKDQMQRVRTKPQSVAKSGRSGKVERSDEDVIFDSILGVDKELESAFG